MSTSRSAPARRSGVRPVDEAVTLVEPGVVFISTAVSVSVRVTDREAAHKLGIPIQENRCHLDRYVGGTGMVVNPNGLIVTASHVVRPDDQQRSRVTRYAANRLLLQGGIVHSLDENADLFNEHQIGDRALDELLRRFYDEMSCQFDIQPLVTVLTPVHIASESPSGGLPARILRFTGFEATDVAILRVDASDMPTVPLATSIAHVRSGQFVTALGFPGSVRDPSIGAREPAKLLGRINIRSEGALPSYEIRADLTPGMSGGPTVDLDGNVAGFARLRAEHAVSGHYHTCLLPVDDIRSALRRANVQAARGEVDQLFEQAMECFWDRHYSAAVPLYRRLLDRQPDHQLAAWYLAQAETRVGGTDDEPLPGTITQDGLVAWLVRLLALAAGAATVITVIRRYRLVRRG